MQDGSIQFSVLKRAEANMSAASPSVPTIDVADKRLDEISRLATLLVDQVLNAQLLERPVPDDHIRALLEAGLLLKEYGVDPPSSLGEIMLASEAAEPRNSADSGRAAADNDAGQLPWLIRPFQGGSA
ncbi:hypothetical protein [Methylobacterium sp. J-090]|uniref:hypothetical protein n=1 Tax=Methylobacterium sp. J-090 TaxID=2836666 RepID=UPI001FB9481F|nr:hypothetical protein [Methylobacterium sp. J-090]MCJ2083535.1 hypothetical protein [Methylobacterium sp. J-090]